MTPTTIFVMAALGVLAIFFAIAGWRRRKLNRQDQRP